MDITEACQRIRQALDFSERDLDAQLKVFEGSFASHPLRETGAHQARMQNGVGIKLPQQSFGHSVGRITQSAECDNRGN